MHMHWLIICLTDNQILTDNRTVYTDHRRSHMLTKGIKMQHTDVMTDINSYSPSNILYGALTVINDGLWISFKWSMNHVDILKRTDKFTDRAKHQLVAYLLQLELILSPILSFLYWTTVNAMEDQQALGSPRRARLTICLHRVWENMRRIWDLR